MPTLDQQIDYLSNKVVAAIKPRDANLGQHLKTFQRQHPYHNDLDLIGSQRRTLIGPGRFELDGRRAGLLAKQGLISITDGPFGQELGLTRKGRQSLEDSRDAFDLL